MPLTPPCHADLESEAEDILEYLDDGEEVLVVSRQSRRLPGGSPVMPSTVFATDRKIIIRRPTMLGFREHVEYYAYAAISNISLSKGMFSSELRITVPGMGTASRSNTGYGTNKDGVISAIPKADAYRIIQIARQGMSGAMPGPETGDGQDKKAEPPGQEKNPGQSTVPVEQGPGKDGNEEQDDEQDEECAEEPSRWWFLAHALLGLPAGIIVLCLYRNENRRAGIFHLLHSIWVPAVLWFGLLALMLLLDMEDMVRWWLDDESIRQTSADD